MIPAPTTKEREVIHPFKITLNFLIVCSLLVSCTIFQPSLVNDCQATVDAIHGLTSDLDIPENLKVTHGERTGNEFDPNEYFTVLNHLSMETGYTLDYVYHYGFWPILYARQLDQLPYKDISELDKSTGGNFHYFVSEYDLSVPDYLNHVLVDDTREGYLQFILLLIHGEQFYLFDHALYNDLEVVCNQGGVDDLFTRPPLVHGYEIPEDVHDQARVLDVTPHVTIHNRIAIVQVVVFSKWGGFAEATYTISRDFPHQILDFRVNELVTYNIPIIF
jgi:hypothetical protein